MSKEPKDIVLSDGQQCRIQTCSGLAGRKLVLKIVDLLKPSTTDGKLANSKDVAQKLLSGGNDERFVDKADKLISEILALSYVTVDGNLVHLNDSVFDVIFSCRLDSMIELLIEIMDHNGFFDLIGYLQQVAPMFQSKSKINLPDDIKDDWFFLRLVYSEPQIATLREVEEHYSYLDILKAHDLLDIKEEMKQEEIRKMNEANK